MRLPLLIVMLAWVVSCIKEPIQTRVSPETRISLSAPELLVEREISGQFGTKPLTKPSGLAVDRRGFLFVSDQLSHRIIQLDTQYVFKREIGGYGSDDGHLSSPGKITIDNDLNLLVVDEGNHRVCRFDRQFNYSGEISIMSPDSNGIAEPSGVAVTRAGKIWVTDRRNNRLSVSGINGVFEEFLGDFGSAGGSLTSPEAIALDNGGSLLICDEGNSRVVGYDQFGRYQSEIETEPIEKPFALTVDPDGLIWVLDRTTSKVGLFNSQGKLLSEYGPMLTGSGKPLNAPSDITVVGRNKLLIADSGNNRLLVISVIPANR